MKLLLACLAASLAIPAAVAQQTIFFVPQPDWLGLIPYATTICNGSTKHITTSGGYVYGEAVRQGIRPASQVTILRVIQQAERTSSTRKALLVLEIAGWAATVAMASESLQISEQTRTLIPIGAGVIRFATTVTAREARKVEMPGKPVPTSIDVPARGCVEYTLFGLAYIGNRD